MTPRSLQVMKGYQHFFCNIFFFKETSKETDIPHGLFGSSHDFEWQCLPHESVDIVQRGSFCFENSCRSLLSGSNIQPQHFCCDRCHRSQQPTSQTLLCLDHLSVGENVYTGRGLCFSCLQRDPSQLNYTLLDTSRLKTHRMETDQTRIPCWTIASQILYSI